MVLFLQAYVVGNHAHFMALLWYFVLTSLFPYALKEENALQLKLVGQGSVLYMDYYRPR